MSGRFFVVGSRDQSCKVYSLHSLDGFVPFSLSGHRDEVIGCFFSRDARTIFSISRDAALFVWKWVDKDTVTTEDMEEAVDKMEFTELLVTKGKWKLNGKHFFNMDYADATACAFNQRK